jgi:Holliday junction resolvase RusA-like endonuclease
MEIMGGPKYINTVLNAIQFSNGKSMPVVLSVMNNINYLSCANRLKNSLGNEKYNGQSSQTVARIFFKKEYKMEKQHLILVSPIPVSVNAYLKPHCYIKNGHPIATMFETPEAKNYKRCLVADIRREVKKQGFTKCENKFQHFYMDCVFYFDRIDKDANNYYKLLCDAITESKSVWVDDNVCCERVQGVFYDSACPRIEIDLYPVDYIGVFMNEEELNCFENNCASCSRHRDGRCSILVRSKEGRILSEVSRVESRTVCSKYKLAKVKS